MNPASTGGAILKNKNPSVLVPLLRHRRDDDGRDRGAAAASRALAVTRTRGGGGEHGAPRRRWQFAVRPRRWRSSGQDTAGRVRWYGWKVSDGRKSDRDNLRRTHARATTRRPRHGCCGVRDGVLYRTETNGRATHFHEKFPPRHTVVELFALRLAVLRAGTDDGDPNIIYRRPTEESIVAEPSPPSPIRPKTKCTMWKFDDMIFIFIFFFCFLYIYIYIYFIP